MVRTAAIGAILRNYSALLETLETIANESHDEYGRRANGILIQLQCFDCYFGLKLSFLIFTATEQTSIVLQIQVLSLGNILLVSKFSLQYQRHFSQAHISQQYPASRG